MLFSNIPTTPGIYKITNTINQHMYIGSTINLRKRFREHRSALSAKRHANIHLQRAHDIYGYDAFLFEVLEHIENIEQIIEREQFFLDSIKPHYNISPRAGNTLGMEFTPEHRAKLSASRRLNSGPNAGKKLPSEHVENMRKAKLGKTLSPSHVENIRAGNEGRNLTPEHKSKIAAGNAGRKPSPKAIANSLAARQAKRLAKLQENQPPAS